MNHNSAHQSSLVHVSSLPTGQPFAKEYSTFTTVLQNPPDISHVNKCVPVMVCMPNVFDNITTHNNRLDFTLNTTTGTITITPGFYDTATLAASLQTFLNTFATGNGLGAGITVQQSATTGLFTVTSPTHTLTVHQSSTLAPVLGLIGIDFTTGLQTIEGIFQPANGFTANCVPNVNTAPQILLHCNHSENNSIHSDGKRSHLLAVLEFSDTQRGAQKTFSARDLHQWEVVYNSHRDLRTWTFHMTDTQLRPVFLPGNAPVEVFMKLISTKPS